MRQITKTYNTQTYSITETGIITNINTNTTLIGWIENTGYRAYSLGGVRVNIHRLLAQLFIKNPNNLLEVNHKNGIKLDNELINLEWVTGCINVRHAFTLGLTKNKALIDYKYIPELLEAQFNGTSFHNLALSMGLKESSSLRKLLKREAIRQNKLLEFEAGALIGKNQESLKFAFKINQLDKNKNVIKTFKSINEAARFINGNPGGIHKAINKGICSKNFYWEKVC